MSGTVLHSMCCVLCRFMQGLLALATLRLRSLAKINVVCRGYGQCSFVVKASTLLSVPVIPMIFPVSGKTTCTKSVVTACMMHLYVASMNMAELTNGSCRNLAVKSICGGVLLHDHWPGYLVLLCLPIQLSHKRQGKLQCCPRPSTCDQTSINNHSGC